MNRSFTAFVNLRNDRCLSLRESSFQAQCSDAANRRGFKTQRSGAAFAERKATLALGPHSIDWNPGTLR